MKLPQTGDIVFVRWIDSGAANLCAGINTEDLELSKQYTIGVVSEHSTKDKLIVTCKWVDHDDADQAIDIAIWPKSIIDITQLGPLDGGEIDMTCDCDDN